jgi:hypothetical protein
VAAFFTWLFRFATGIMSDYHPEISLTAIVDRVGPMRIESVAATTMKDGNGV